MKTMQEASTYSILFKILFCEQKRLRDKLINQSLFHYGRLTAIYYKNSTLGLKSDLQMHKMVTILWWLYICIKFKRRLEYSRKQKVRYVMFTRLQSLYPLCYANVSVKLRHLCSAVGTSQLKLFLPQKQCRDLETHSPADQKTCSRAWRKEGNTKTQWGGRNETTRKLNCEDLLPAETWSGQE